MAIKVETTMDLREIGDLGDDERAKLRAMADLLPKLAKEFDEVLARNALGHLKMYSFALTANSNESLSKLVPKPAGIGVTSAGQYVSSAAFT